MVQKDAVESFKEAVGKHYEEIVGHAPLLDIYIATLARGTGAARQVQQWAAGGRQGASGRQAK